MTFMDLDGNKEYSVPLLVQFEDEEILREVEKNATSEYDGIGSGLKELVREAAMKIKTPFPDLEFKSAILTSDKPSPLELPDIFSSMDDGSDFNPRTMRDIGERTLRFFEGRKRKSIVYMDYEEYNDSLKVFFGEAKFVSVVPPTKKIRPTALGPKDCRLFRVSWKMIDEDAEDPDDRVILSGSANVGAYVKNDDELEEFKTFAKESLPVCIELARESVDASTENFWEMTKDLTLETSVVCLSKVIRVNPDIYRDEDGTIDWNEEDTPRSDMFISLVGSKMLENFLDVYPEQRDIEEKKALAK